MAPSHTSSCTNFHVFGAFFTSKVTAFWGWMLDVTAQTHTCARREDGNRGMEHATSDENKRLRIHGTMCLGHARGWCASARTYAIKSIIHTHVLFMIIRSFDAAFHFPFHSNQGTFLHHAYSNIKYSIYTFHTNVIHHLTRHQGPRLAPAKKPKVKSPTWHSQHSIAQSIVRCQYLWPRIQDTKYTV